MTQFKGFIGLDQLSPEVREYINKAIDEKVSEALENVSIAPALSSVSLQGLIAVGPNQPEGQVDIWIQPETDDIAFNSITSNVILTEDVSSVENPEIGSTVVELEE